jgi:Schlafen, AlbA_2
VVLICQWSVAAQVANKSVHAPPAVEGQLMKGYAYVPFQGNMETLKGPELATLRGVNEGWYVDYKESVPDIKSLAKHVSAFANQYGGWLFLGVKEKQGEGMTAESFPGIPSNSVPAAQLALRQAASAHVNPPLILKCKPSTGLSANWSYLLTGL